MPENLIDLLKVAVSAAQLGGMEIMEIYESDDFGVEAKADESPLTLADKAAHEAIVAELEKTGLPILSEEGANIPFEERKNWQRFWMVDPLDGTKEFIKRNGEFTVNIALIENGVPILGALFVPVTETMYLGGKGIGAYKQVAGGKALKMPTSTLPLSPIKVVGSRSHMNEETAQFVSNFKDHEMIAMGSSLKFMVVADGAAHFYPRFAPTMEWDTAAAQAIVEASGKRVVVAKNGKETPTPVSYNKKNLLNPHFLVK